MSNSKQQKPSFDRYFGIDWSGAKSPIKTNSIAVAHCEQSSSTPPVAITEKLSRTDVFELIAKQLTHSIGRSFIGIDCNLGYCAHIAQKQVTQNINFLELWRTVDNVNKAETNFFAGRFWNHVNYSKYFWQGGKQPSWFKLHELRRETEKQSVKKNIGTPESPFKLIGAKQVGKGGLAGMRVLYSLKQRYGDCLAIWPFEQHLIDTAKVVVSEVYPRLFIRHAGFGNRKIRRVEDLNQILSHFQTKPYDTNVVLNDHLSDAIISSAGLRWFLNGRYSLLKELPKKATELEGWIFGV